MQSYDYSQASAVVLSECSQVLQQIDPRQLARLMDYIQHAHTVFVIGVGRVMIAMQSWIKRFNHLGVRMVQVGALDEPALQPGDLLIVASGSGNTILPLTIAQKAKSLGANVVHIGANQDGKVAAYRDYFVQIPASGKTCSGSQVPSVQPMTSLFEQCLFLLGDILTMMMLGSGQRKDDDLWKYHANLE